MKYTTEWITVRYGETDQMRFVHHSNYLRYFELARLEWLSSMGVSYAEMEREGILMPVAHASLNFKSPVFWRCFSGYCYTKKDPNGNFGF